MRKSILAPLSATLVVLAPAAIFAQVAACAPASSSAPSTAKQTFNSAVSVFGPTLINPGPAGAVNPRTNNSLQIIAPALNQAENNVVDIFAYGGPAFIDVERYNWDGHTFTAVRSGDNVGGMFGAAFTGSGDPADAGLVFIATENQTPSHNGMGTSIWYTANGTTALKEGLGVSMGGNGGVTVGGSNAWGGEPSDLGHGTLHAADSIVTDNHLRTAGAHGTVTSCGTNPVFDRGTDQAGAIATGGAVTSCTYAFAKSWGRAPICQVQLYNAASPTPYISSELATSITVSFSASFKGTFQFICMGVG